MMLNGVVDDLRKLERLLIADKWYETASEFLVRNAHSHRPGGGLRVKQPLLDTIFTLDPPPGLGLRARKERWETVSHRELVSGLYDITNHLHDLIHIERFRQISHIVFLKERFPFGRYATRAEYKARLYGRVFLDGSLVELEAVY